MTSSQLALWTPAAAPERRRAAFARDAEQVLSAAPWLALAAILVWIAIGMATATSQWGDHFEQFTWAHGVELGYHKHPPLPTWMLAAAIAVFGPSVHSAELLAAACLAGTALFTYGVARELLGRPTAALALLFWGLQQPFSLRSHLFNHNTVLALATSATAWMLLRALRDERALRWWVGVGVGAGLAMLAKYQAVVPLAGLLVATQLGGDLASPRVRRGLLLAGAVAVAVFAPHVAWALRNELSTLAYATAGRTPPDVAHSLWNVVSFIGQQLRLVAPAGLLAVVLMMLPGARPVALASDPRAARRRAWLIGLVAFPFLATLAAGPLFGLVLRNHWGHQALQFVALALACWVRPRICVAAPSWAAAAFLVHGVLLGLAIQGAVPSAPDAHRRDDRLFPAQALADQVRRDWHDRTTCPLRVVVGPTFEAGMVSVYGGGTARVLEDGDFVKSPWISADDVREHGAVYVANDPAALPTKGAAVVSSLDVGPVSPTPTHRIYWAVVPPETCAVDAWSNP